jgi:hypothetical protein
LSGLPRGTLRLNSKSKELHISWRELLFLRTLMWVILTNSSSSFRLTWNLVWPQRMALKDKNKSRLSTNGSSKSLMLSIYQFSSLETSMIYQIPKLSRILVLVSKIFTRWLMNKSTRKILDIRSWLTQSGLACSMLAKDLRWVALTTCSWVTTSSIKLTQCKSRASCQCLLSRIPKRRRRPWCLASFGLPITTLWCMISLWVWIKLKEIELLESTNNNFVRNLMMVSQENLIRSTLAFRRDKRLKPTKKHKRSSNYLILRTISNRKSRPLWKTNGLKTGSPFFRERSLRPRMPTWQIVSKQPCPRSSPCLRTTDVKKWWRSLKG